MHKHQSLSYGYEVVCGKRHAIIKQAEMLPISTQELSHVQ